MFVNVSWADRRVNHPRLTQIARNAALSPREERVGREGRFWNYFQTLSDFAAAGYLIIEMQSKSDAQLLREYAELGIETAFTPLGVVSAATPIFVLLVAVEVHSWDELFQ